MAQRRESKFFLSGWVSPLCPSQPNLHPNRCMPRILMQEEGEGRGVSKKRKTNRKQRGTCLLQVNILDAVQINRNKHSGRTWWVFTRLFLPAACVKGITH